MQIALFGFPMTGKTTLFTLLTGIEPTHHGGRGEVLVGIAKVPDNRLDKLTAMYKPKKRVPATVEYLDIAGIEKGEAAKALPIDKLRSADALAHVVRGFQDESIPHSEGDVNPARDVDTMETEFILADLAVVEKRIEKLKLLIMKVQDADDKKELAIMEHCLTALEEETPLRNLDMSEDDLRRIRGYTFLTLKPLLVVVNADEADADKLAKGAAGFGLAELEQRPATHVIALSAKIEAEIAELDDDEAAEFRSDLGIDEPALERVIQGSYTLLGQIAFFTVGEDECRAWTIKKGTVAQKAAGVIHSDIERGFIRAEMVAYDDLMEAGTWAACRDKGTLRLEGKEHVFLDGDVVNFRFNV